MRPGVSVRLQWAELPGCGLLCATSATVSAFRRPRGTRVRIGSGFAALASFAGPAPERFLLRVQVDGGLAGQTTAALERLYRAYREEPKGRLLA